MKFMMLSILYRSGKRERTFLHKIKKTSSHAFISYTALMK